MSNQRRKLTHNKSAISKDTEALVSGKVQTPLNTEQNHIYELDDGKQVILSAVPASECCAPKNTMTAYPRQGHPVPEPCQSRAYSNELRMFTETPASLELRGLMPELELRVNEILFAAHQQLKEPLDLLKEKVNDILESTKAINKKLDDTIMNLQLHKNNNVPSSSASIESLIGTTTTTAAAAAASPLPPITSTSTAPLPPSLSKSSVTVRQLWNEWKVTGSYCTNYIPVEELNRTLGTKWRSANKDRAFYSRRKTVIDEVEKRSSQGKMTVDEAIEQCQAEIGKGDVCKGLDSYVSYLRKKNKKDKEESQNC